MWLYFWEKYGYEKAEQIFKRDYITDKGHVKNFNTHLINVLDGKLEFLKMVKGAEDGTYKGLKERFDKLIGGEDPINQILNVWETEGIDQAMDIYYKNKPE
jgi:RNA-directed DNA polymerase